MMDKCEACGHIRYVLAGDSFNGECETCCVWAERKMMAADKEIAALKAELARYTGPLTDEQIQTVLDACYYLITGEVVQFDAAIREVRGK